MIGARTLFLLMACGAFATAAETSHPKYAPTTLPLSLEHEYFRHHAAPLFWKLIPYYVPQEEHACSAASIVMMLNALNSSRELKSTDELVRQKPLIEKVNNPVWKKAIESGHCLDLDALAAVLKDVLKIYDQKEATVEVTHIFDQGPGPRKALHEALVAAESGKGGFVLANFIQGILTGDPEGMEAGHMSLVGAYDVAKKRVLILDVDRQWYEPYWVAEETLLKGMNTSDKEAKRYRGFLRVLKN
jgi:hypothetical protein